MTDSADATRALAVVAAKLLAAKGKRELAAIVERSSLTVVPGIEQWQVGSRVVEAHRLALVASPEDFVRLRIHENELEDIRWAIASSVKSGTTELAELLVVVRLPWVDLPWAAAYRTAPPAAEDEAPESVVEGAAALANAYGYARVADVLRRSTLEAYDVPSEGLPQRRLVLRLLPRDLVVAERDNDLAEHLRRCITHAATRAAVRIGTVELRVRSDGTAT